MATLAGNALAVLTCRSGAARSGAVRCSYTPRNTVNSPGTATGPFVRYTRTDPAAVIYTVTTT